MIPHPRAASHAVAAALLLAASGCAGSRYARMSAPEGSRALGLEFGASREATERALAAAGIAHAPAPADPDALVADRCPDAPVAATCRLVFGPEGLYAAELELPLGDSGALVAALERTLGPPGRRGDPRAPQPDGLVAAWERPAWTVGVSRLAPQGAAPSAALSLEYEPAAPPVVVGVPLGRLRADVEHVLDRQGATVISRDGGSTAYLGCPLGDGDAISCVVTFRGGRAASVTEVHVTPADDVGALAAWRGLAGKLETEIGRAPSMRCPAEGPDRIAGDCTASWPTDRLVVTAGAHRSAGGKHRGAISVYTGFAYPPLARGDDEDEQGSQPDAAAR